MRLLDLSVVMFTLVLQQNNLVETVLYIPASPIDYLKYRKTWFAGDDGLQNYLSMVGLRPNYFGYFQKYSHVIL